MLSPSGLIPKDTNKLHQDVERNTDEWRRLIYNHNVLQKKTNDLGEDYERIKNGSGIHSNERALKMQRQDDIRNQIDHDSNVVIFSGVGLTVVFITVLMLYMK